MQRVRGGDGRFVRAGAATDESSGRAADRVGSAAVLDADDEEELPKKFRLGMERKRARKAFGRALPEIVKKVTELAKEGSVAHVRLLLQMEKEFRMPAPEQRRERTLEEILTAQWEKDEALKAESERLNA